MTLNTEALHRDLHERNVDVLIARRSSPVADEREGFEYLFDDSYVVVAGAQHPIARRRKTALAGLMNERWVLPPPENPLGSIAMDAFRASGFDYPRTIVFAVNPDVRTSLLATGRFLTIFSAISLRFLKGRPELKVLPVNLPLARVQIGIITLKNRTLSPVAQLFIEHARELAKPLAKTKS